LCLLPDQIASIIRTSWRIILRVRQKCALSALSLLTCLLAASAPASDSFPYDQRELEAVLVKDINPTTSSNPDYLILLGSSIFFSANDGVRGTELWVLPAEGSPKIAADIHPTSSSAPRDLTRVGNALYFAANDGVKGEELWVYSSNKARLVADMRSNGSSSPRELADYNGTLYFSADDGINGRELWKYKNGSADRVGNIYPDSGSSNPAWMTKAFGTLYFSANNYWNGIELFKLKSNGEPVMAANIKTTGSTNPQYLTMFNGELYFSGEDGVHGVELLKIDAANNWSLVKDIYPGGDHSFPRYMTVFDNAMYFSANDGVHGFELWRVTASGKVEMVRDINVGGNAFPAELSAIGNNLYFYADDGFYGYELWKLSKDKIELVVDINSGGNSFPTNMTLLNGTLYFAANDGLYGRELWKLIKARPPCRLPDTGFSPNHPAVLIPNPRKANPAVTTDILLSIPSLGVESRIVEVPLRNCQWDLTWLDSWVGYLEGTVFPTLPGNTALTAHNMLPGDIPGPFLHLDQLVYNDPIYIYAWGLKYTYGVYSKKIVSPTDFSVLDREEKDVITLISCKAYDPDSDSYLLRMVVQATLVKIERDPEVNSETEEEYFEQEEWDEELEPYEEEILEEEPEL